MKRKEKFKVGDRVRFKGTVVRVNCSLGRNVIQVKGKIFNTIFSPQELTKIRR